MDESTRSMADEPVNVHDRIRGGLQRLATWPSVLLAMLVALLCIDIAGFQWRDVRLGGLELLDTRQWRTHVPAFFVEWSGPVDPHDDATLVLKRAR